MTVALLGTGNIAGQYASSIAGHQELELIGVFDIDQEKAAQFAEDHGVAVFPSLEALCHEPVDVVGNLTSAPLHFGTTRELLERGKSVFSEKPLALRSDEARELIALAEEKGLRLACAPSLWLGASPQKVATVVRSGELGTVRLVTADINHGRIELWHPNPQHIYSVGPVADVGVYALTFLTAVLGPVRTVQAQASMLLPSRRTVAGEDFTLTTADSWLISGELEGGTVFRLTCNFFVSSATIPETVDFHGDLGSIRVRDQYRPEPGVDRAEYGEPFTEWIPHDESAPVDFAIGLVDMARAISEGRPHKTSADHAAHIVEVLEAISTSASTGKRCEVTSSFELPGIND